MKMHYYAIIQFMKVCSLLTKDNQPKESSKKIVTEFIAWWVKAGYLCQSENALIKNMLNLDKNCKSLNQYYKKIWNGLKKLTPSMEQKQDQFIEKS